MAVKKVVKLVTKHSANGTFLGIQNNKIMVEDDKTGEQSLDLGVFDEMVGKKINFTLSNEEEVDEEE